MPKTDRDCKLARQALYPRVIESKPFVLDSNLRQTGGNTTAVSLRTYEESN
jgi:hypothetical protein